MKQVWGITIRLLAALTLAVLASAPAHARTPVQTCIAPLKDSAAAPLPFDCSDDQRRYGSGDFGVQLRFDPVVSTVDDPLVLRTTSVWQGSERVVFRYADGTIAALSFSQQTARRYIT
ncbi:MAG: hypothetical protein C0515_12645, partial [Novosphingobium sp.]|nr:hypothetical protein [Novosphingobium sp.]